MVNRLWVDATTYVGDNNQKVKGTSFKLWVFKENLSLHKQIMWGERVFIKGGFASNIEDVKSNSC